VRRPPSCALFPYTTLFRSAHAADTGTLVVRVVTDPSPPGVSWTYRGAGTAFQLGSGPSRRSVSLAAGTHHVAETPAAGGPPTLTDRKSTRLNSSHLGISYA